MAVLGPSDERRLAICKWLTANRIDPNTVPLHNARLANPIDPLAKAMKKISSKRVKTEDDHQEMSRLEHAGGLYYDQDAGPYLPGENIQRCLTDAARVTRAGKKIERGVFISTNINPIGYQGPRDVDGLWADENFRHMASVKVQTSRVMRCRPRFRSWTVEADGGGPGNSEPWV